MNTRPLGQTGLVTSEIGLGTWALASQIYGAVGEADAHETVRAALDAGVTFFDTAPLYGDAERDGIAETLLGRALGSDRDRVLISSKFGRYSTESEVRFDAQRARESVEGSLRRLGTDRIDVLFFHSPFGQEDIADDVWDELERLRDEGKVRVLGHSISKFEKTENMAREWAAERKIGAVQVVYSLMNRQAAALIGEMAEAGVGVVARESLANGFLSGALGRDSDFEAGHLNARYSRDEIQARVVYAERLGALVRGDVESLPQAAFRWVLDAPGVSLVLSGASTAAQLRDGAAASAAAPFSASEHAWTMAIHPHDFQAA